MKNEKQIMLRDIGAAFCFARRAAHVPRNRVAKFLGLSQKDLGRFENGTKILPRETMTQIFQRFFDKGIW